MKQGVYTMKELKRITVIQSIIDGKRTQKEAAISLNISERQIRKIVKRYRELGPNSIIHQNKYRKPSHAISDELKHTILQLKLSDDYINTNFSHFKDLLKEREDINISYSALYNLLTSYGLHSEKAHRARKTHRRRKRKECEGMLVQTDGTPFDWFQTGTQYSLHGYIDDATGKILGLYMCEHECLMGYLEITRQMLVNYGSPVAIYSDKYSVFFPTCSQKVTIEEQLEGKEKPTTQFHRIMDFLGIELIAASTSQAKGRIERLWETLQDRLVTEFKLNHITTIQQANEFLPSYIKKYNKQFAIDPKDHNSKFVPLPAYVNLDLLLTNKLTRVIDCSGTFSIHNKRFQIINNDILPKAKVNVYISHKIGIIVEYKEKQYKVICSEDVPSTYSAMCLNKFYKEHELAIKTFATDLCSSNSKTSDPLLVTS